MARAFPKVLELSAPTCAKPFWIYACIFFIYGPLQYCTRSPERNMSEPEGMALAEQKTSPEKASLKNETVVSEFA